MNRIPTLLIAVAILALGVLAPVAALALPQPGDPPPGSMIPGEPLVSFGQSIRAYSGSFTASGATLSWDIGESTGWVRFAGAYTDTVDLIGVGMYLSWTPPGPIKVSATVTSLTPSIYNIDHYYVDGSGDTYIYSGDLSGSRIFDFTFPYNEGFLQDTVRLRFDEFETPCDILIELEWGEPTVDSLERSWGGVKGLYR